MTQEPTRCRLATTDKACGVIDVVLLGISRSQIRVGILYTLKIGNRDYAVSIKELWSANTAPRKVYSLSRDELAYARVGVDEIFDVPYASEIASGCLILIDPNANRVIGVGIIKYLIESSEEIFCRPSSGGGIVVWLTGLSGSGKTTLARAVKDTLRHCKVPCVMLDADVMRDGINRDLGFGRTDRIENVMRLGFLAKLLAKLNYVVLVSSISPYLVARTEIRKLISNYIEVYLAAPLSVCAERDPRGLYKKAFASEIKGFTGVDDPYEQPINPEMRCETHRETIAQSGNKITQYILARVAREMREHGATERDGLVPASSQIVSLSARI